MGKVITYAKLQQPIFVAGTGNLSDTLDPAKHLGIKMVLTDEGLLVDHKGISFVVPIPNVAVAVFSEKNVAAAALEVSSKKAK